MADDLPAFTRQVAHKIWALPDVVQAAFRNGGQGQIIKVRSACSEIQVDMLRIVGWVERNRPDAADLLKSRLFCVIEEAVACAMGDNRDFSAKSRSARFVALAKPFAISVQDWAAEIERANAPPAEGGLQETGAAVCLGNRRYRIAKDAPFILDEAEDTIVVALIELGGAATKQELVNRSGKQDAPRILKQIHTKYPALQPFIILPGGKGKGGYRTTITLAAN